MNLRMFPPVEVEQQTRIVNGRTYTGTTGSVVDVVDFDGSVLAANGWVVVAPSGPTSARPVGSLGQYPAARGVKFFDETLDALIVFDGSVWRNPASGAAV